MRFAALCILLLAISEPLLSSAKKLVVMVPRQIKRSPAIGWRPSSMHYRKSSPANDFRHYGYHGRPNHYYEKRPYHRAPPFPSGGDDFDQGYEGVNHVHVPYGKDYGHQMSFGKGYSPYDPIKGSFSFARERYPKFRGHKYMEPDYSPTGFTSSGPDYQVPTGHSYEGPSMEGLFADPESAMDYRERRNDRKKYYASRSIDKDLGLKNSINLNNVNEKDKEQQPKVTEFYKQPMSQGHEMQGAILLPAGIPAATIAGNKDGIVFRDTVALDDYHRKLQEITNSWPSFLTGGVSDANAALQQQIQNSQQYQTAGLPSASSYTGPSGWFADYAQAKQSYAVKEDVAEPPPDFRNMPIQNAPFHNVPLTVNVGVAGVGQPVNG